MVTASSKSTISYQIINIPNLNSVKVLQYYVERKQQRCLSNEQFTSTIFHRVLEQSLFSIYQNCSAQELPC